VNLEVTREPSAAVPLALVVRRVSDGARGVARKCVARAKVSAPGAIEEFDEGDCGYHVELTSCEGLIEFAKRDGFLVWDAGWVGYSDEDRGDDHVFTDQCCSTCGHTPCPCCGTFCDVSECISADDGHDCKYESEPRFFLGDGSLWEG
jgi:hypothetical protein